MFFTNKTILLISPEPWDHIKVSKHYYALELAKRGNRVVFLNPPADFFQIENSDQDNIQVCHYQGFWKGLKYMPKFLRSLNQRNVFKKIELESKLKFDLVWSFDNSVFFDFDALPSRLVTISHIVDLNMSFQFSKASNSADICLASSRYILAKQKKDNSNCHFIQHGCSFVGQDSKTGSGTKVKIGYAGNLDISYIDWNLLGEVIVGFSECEFYFAGSGTVKKTSDNVYSLGKLDKKQLASFYNDMDVLLICYKANEFKQQLANPHKMMEYLAFGKPIVATYTEEFAELEFISMSKRSGDWVDMFRNVIQNLEKHTSKELVAKRKKFATNNTYEKQLNRIEKMLIDL